MKILPDELHQLLGNIDIYLLDQILKGQFQPNMKILDAGCGEGRNLVYFLKNNYNVHGIDQNPAAVQSLIKFAQSVDPTIDKEKFINGSLDNLPYTNRSFDAIICSAVLHFAEDVNHFNKMVREIWRVMKFGGFMFCRLASDIGIENLVKPLGNRRFLVPDGSTRFLVNEEMLVKITEELGGILMEPIKTVNVQNSRCMTNWIVSKVL
ncbi:MAG TPA: class I SAM-dependent methyltransferase [Cytophagales bacterium]|nr:class I SAM-dependent methyltransferase [Cytophagales bacterium]